MKSVPVIVITGCSRGIGRALAKSLGEKNYRVVATARHRESLADLPVQARLTLDVTKTEDVKNASELVKEQFGRIDVLINNAGIALKGSVEDVTEGQWQHLFDINVMGPVRMIQAFAPHFRQQGHGRIVNVTTLSTVWGTPFLGTYAGSKAALETVSMALGRELSPWGISVIVLRIGLTDTELLAKSHERSERWVTSRSPYWEQYQTGEKIFNRIRRYALRPEIVVRDIERVINRPHPRAVWTIPWSARVSEKIMPFVRILKIGRR